MAGQTYTSLNLTGLLAAIGIGAFGLYMMKDPLFKIALGIVSLTILVRWLRK